MLVPFLIVVLIVVLMLVFSQQKNSGPHPIWKKLESMVITNGEKSSWSSNRVAFLFTMILSNVIVWGAIVYLTLLNGAFPDIPQSIVIIYGAANGIASIAKVWQKREERFQIESNGYHDTTGDEEIKDNVEISHDTSLPKITN